MIIWFKKEQFIIGQPNVLPNVTLKNTIFRLSLNKGEMCVNAFIYGKLE